jgi:hypothetical protein
MPIAPYSLRRSARTAFICLFSLQILAVATSAAIMEDHVAIDLRGRIEPKCSLSEMGGRLTFTIGADRGRYQSAALGFTINCNTPFIYRLSADHGAMRLQGAGAASDDARLQLPYRVSLTIPTQGGGTMSAQCGGEALGAAGAGACEADSGDRIAINKRGRITVNLPAGAEQPMEGQYTENMRIEVAVKQ